MASSRDDAPDAPDGPGGTATPGARGPRVAVIGAGPSGIFAAQALVSRSDARVDVYDRLPAPYGLLRYGVAPDHTSIKGVATALARVFDDDRVSFVGMVELGVDVTAGELLEAYDAVIYAAGASEDQRMRIPGEDLPGSRSAREVVAWYSGHPDAVTQSFAGVTTAVMVGVGNVAVDVARILLKTASQLASTDMPTDVLAELRDHHITDVWVVGRRGPHHASFTTVELRELLAIPGVQPIVHPGAFDGIDEAGLDRRTRGNVEALREAAGRAVDDARARLHLLFWHRPVRVAGDGRVESIVLEPTRVDESGRVVAAGPERALHCELVLRAIGYRGKPLPELPFDDERGVVPNEGGRVTDLAGRVLPGHYVVGWIKRGPMGVIGTNKSDAVQTVEHLLADVAVAPPRPLREVAELWAAKGMRPTSFDDWRRIDAAEAAQGEEEGRQRSKIAAWTELIEIAHTGRPGGPPTPGDQP